MSACLALVMDRKIVDIFKIYSIVKKTFTVSGEYF